MTASGTTPALQQDRQVLVEIALESSIVAEGGKAKERKMAINFLGRSFASTALCTGNSAIEACIRMTHFLPPLDFAME